jgi:hypothetical protein
VLKPRIEATAYGTYLIERDSQLDVACLAPAPASVALLQAVESSRGPLLMEVELIEPELYFLLVPPPLIGWRI